MVVAAHVRYISIHNVRLDLENSMVQPTRRDHDHFFWSCCNTASALGIFSQTRH